MLLGNRVENVRDYLNIIDAVSSLYSNERMRADLLFRGHSIYEHRLIPGVFRKLMQQSDKGEKNCALYGDAAEYAILRHFIKNAMSQVNHIDKDDLLTWLTYAQHFGAPTRLLDFASNPLISLYFCCLKEPEEDGCVCVLHEKNYVQSLHLNTDKRSKGDVLEEILLHVVDPAMRCTPYPVTFIPHYIDNRMEAQSSRFLVWGSDHSAFEQIAAPYGDMLQQDSGAFFCKIRVYGPAKAYLLDELSFLGINEKKLFPGLDGIGRYINAYYRQVGENNCTG